jgi:hypothetical protein
MCNCGYPQGVVGGPNQEAFSVGNITGQMMGAGGAKMNMSGQQHQRMKQEEEESPRVRQIQHARRMMPALSAAPMSGVQSNQQGMPRGMGGGLMY